MLTYKGPPLVTRRVWFTGKTINATAGSRTAISTGLISSQVPPGATLIRDPYGHDEGIGQDYTQPQTSFLHEQAVVVVKVVPKESGATGQWVEVVEKGEYIEAMVKINATLGSTILGPVNGQFALGAVAGGTAGAIRVDSLANLGADVGAIYRTGKALALETSDTSAVDLTTAAGVSSSRKKVRLGLYSNASNS